MYWNETPTRLTCGSVNCEKAPLCCDAGQKVVPTIHLRDRKNIVEYSEIKRFETSQMNSILIACPCFIVGGGGGYMGIFATVIYS